ncbi:chalcone isomerase family protein [Ancylomarina longa]|uniref:Chalcone isomerase n=1 Tax=Ancylomarina longa TaxID=2487017 RepID=A0A434AFG0_9BACT|nr:chalcone isomerase family protein [Ancylomarina longa]RUT73082.1 chalcone isomerase [Ancylomarina longa]
MKKLLTLALTLISFYSFSQTKIGNVELPNEIVIKDYQMQLHGSGTRVKLWMDMYAMGLYLTEDMNQAEQIINSDESMGIRLEIISRLISSEKMEKATREGFENATKGNTKSIKTEIEDFISVFKTGVDKKDIFEFVYIPNDGTMVYKNGDLKTSIAGLPFKQALFGIWLCNKPADKNLKKNLLK